MTNWEIISQQPGTNNMQLETIAKILTNKYKQ